MMSSMLIAFATATAVSAIRVQDGTPQVRLPQISAIKQNILRKAPDAQFIKSIPTKVLHKLVKKNKVASEEGFLDEFEVSSDDSSDFEDAMEPTSYDELVYQVLDAAFNQPDANDEESVSKLTRQASRDMEQENVQSSVEIVSEEDMKARAISWANANGQSGQGEKFFKKWVEYRNKILGSSSLTWAEAEEQFLTMQEAAYEKVMKEKTIFDFKTKAEDDGSSVVFLQDPNALANSSLTGEELCLALAYMFRSTEKNTFVFDWRVIESMNSYSYSYVNLARKLNGKIGQLKDIGFEAVFNMRTLYVMKANNNMVGADEDKPNVRSFMPLDMQNMI